MLNDLVTVRSDPNTERSATTPVVDHAYTNPKKEDVPQRKEQWELTYRCRRA